MTRTTLVLAIIVLAVAVSAKPRSHHGSSPHHTAPSHHRQLEDDQPWWGRGNRVVDGRPIGRSCSADVRYADETCCCSDGGLLVGSGECNGRFMPNQNALLHRLKHPRVTNHDLLAPSEPATCKSIDFECNFLNRKPRSAGCSGADGRCSIEDCCVTPAEESGLAAINWDDVIPGQTHLPEIAAAEALLAHHHQEHSKYGTANARANHGEKCPKGYFSGPRCACHRAPILAFNKQILKQLEDQIKAARKELTLRATCSQCQQLMAEVDDPASDYIGRYVVCANPANNRCEAVEVVGVTDHGCSQKGLIDFASVIAPGCPSRNAASKKVGRSAFYAITE